MRRWALGTVALVASLCAPSASQAAVTLGPEALPMGGSQRGCSLTEGVRCSYVHTVLAGGTLNAPFDGVVVRWRVRAGSGTNPEGQGIQVVRNLGANVYTAVSTSALTPVTSSQVNVVDTRIPIAQGDEIAVLLSGGPSIPSIRAISGVFGNLTGEWNPALVDGEAPGRTPTGEYGSEVLLFNADVEPDADGDGFGDETQDQCPTEAGAESGCAPPDTSITKGPKDRTTKKRATFEFSGTDARALAGFECSLDRGAFAACISPFKVKVKKGKHTFQVRAIDAAGNVDSSPASDDWKVKRKKK